MDSGGSRTVHDLYQPRGLTLQTKLPHFLYQHSPGNLLKKVAKSWVMAGIVSRDLGSFLSLISTLCTRLRAAQVGTRRRHCGSSGVRSRLISEVPQRRNNAQTQSTKIGEGLQQVAKLKFSLRSFVFLQRQSIKVIANCSRIVN